MMMDSLPAGMKWILAQAYLNDTVVYSTTFFDRLSCLESLAKRVKKTSCNQIQINLLLCKNETAYLEFIEFAEGVKSNPAKEFIRGYLVSRDRRAKRHFSGNGNYYRRFIHNYARHAELLQRWFLQNVKLVWGEEKKPLFKIITQRKVRQL